MTSQRRVYLRRFGVFGVALGIAMSASWHWPDEMAAEGQVLGAVAAIVAAGFAGFAFHKQSQQIDDLRDEQSKREDREIRRDAERIAAWVEWALPTHPTVRGAAGGPSEFLGDDPQVCFVLQNSGERPVYDLLVHVHRPDGLYTRGNPTAGGALDDRQPVKILPPGMKRIVGVSDDRRDVHGMTVEIWFTDSANREWRRVGKDLILENENR